MCRGASTTSASGVISQVTEKAKRSTFGRREHRSALSNRGSISILLSTRYTVVPLMAASSSRAVCGLTKWVTSAMWTPTSKFPLGRAMQCRASSMSSHPGGSIEHIRRPATSHTQPPHILVTHKPAFRRSLRRATSASLIVCLPASGGRQAKTAVEKGRTGTSCSTKIT